MGSHDYGEPFPMPQPTPEEVSAFCDNLKKSLLDYLERGQAVHIAHKADWEPVYGNQMVVDYSYEGCTYKIRLGRPARNR